MDEDDNGRLLNRSIETVFTHTNVYDDTSEKLLRLRTVIYDLYSALLCGAPCPACYEQLTISLTFHPLRTCCKFIASKKYKYWNVKRNFK